WFLAATNQSFVGWLMDKNRAERFYNMGNRFTTVQLGMNVNLFTKAQKARINAAEKNEKLAEATANYALTEWQTQQKQLLEQQKNAWLQIQYFKSSALPQATILMQQANSLYKNGQISYIEWNTAVRNALQTEWQFAETVANFNQLGIKLQYLLTDNVSINE
ncbi:MAG: TolC family protein, partial [Chitinophagaceae bacterium]